MPDFFTERCDDPAHAHVFGPFERSRLAGTLHRQCTVDPACRVVSLDGDDDE